ncbi:MAG: HD domain-containing protein [Lachnospiraceae bacterium]|nr:HD domain-containing protein [Lachnospiraceae bacterium]
MRIDIKHTAALPAVFIITMLLASFMFSDVSYAGYAGGLINSSGNENRPLSVDPSQRSEGFSAVLFDNQNGLPTSEANAIAETSDGFIWIGSYAGLIRYDGNTFERMDSTGGLTSIKCLFVDSSDRLWIGTNDNGIAVMERGELKRWSKLDGMTSAHTRDITEGKDGMIYVATTNGITMIDQDYNLTAVEEPEVVGADMRYLRTGTDGMIYATTNEGSLMLIRDGKLQRYVSVEASPIGGAGAVIPDPDDPYRVYQEAADNKLYHVDLKDGFKEIDRIDIAPLKYVMNMEIIDGKLWICTGNGVGVLENRKFRALSNLPINNNVGHVMTDYLGNLWFTSTRQGVLKVVPNQFSDLFARYDLPEAVVNSTAICDDMLFAATDTGLIVIDEKGVVESLPLTEAVTAKGEELHTEDLIDHLKESRIRSVIRDSRGRLWISTWRSGGLLCYDRGKLTSFNTEDGLLSDSIRAVCERKDGTILVALTGGVSLIKDGSVIGSYGKEDGIETTETLCVEEGFDGEIILGSNGGGMYIISGSECECINVEEGLPSDIVMRVKRDPKRDLIWLVTSSAIAYMTPDHKVTTIQKFPYPNNFDLYENSRGDMWILASNGIYVIPAADLIANKEINPVFYGLASGLPVIATANSYSELTSEGDLYIAGSTGICKVNIESSLEDVADLKAVVPFVEADGEMIWSDRSGVYTIPSDTRKLTVYDYVFNYSLADPKVSYRLEGFDHSSTTIDRSDMIPVEYTNLRGGTYEFVMEIKDSMGHSSKVVSVKIVKEKAFYEETWFYILTGFLVFGLIALLTRFIVLQRTKILERKQREAHEQFEQTAEALASAIDAKDAYTNGHSRRVAEYSRAIAEKAGKTEEECEKVYFAALLHDVGKIGVPIEILSKNGRLTDEEFEQIKQHPVVGGQILSSIRKSPWLSVGARYHHERYNGRGYPEGLKGEDIPEIARIIAVADAYDAMTSNRSYRNAIPQHIVREELVKGIGTQFDPGFVKIMIHMIDLDIEYRMKEAAAGQSDSSVTGIRCDSLYHECTPGYTLTENVTRIRLCSQPDEGAPAGDSLPVLVLFDSLDGSVHPGEEENRNILYYEYAQIRFDGQVVEKNVRKSEVSVSEEDILTDRLRPGETEPGQRYAVEAFRKGDHVLVRIGDEKQTFRIILALPDSSRFVYAALGGNCCFIHNISSEKMEDSDVTEEIPRIAEEVSYISGCPEGDVPNVQIDSWCAASTDGFRIGEDMTLAFHSMSLPSARLVWHCAYISIFSSENGRRDGEGFREYLLLRLNGEDWTSDEHAKNSVEVVQKEDFAGWNIWKDRNREGIDCAVRIRKQKNRITIDTENLGIAIKSETTILDDVKDIYVAVTGDQCAVTNVRVAAND